MAKNFGVVHASDLDLAELLGKGHDLIITAADQNVAKSQPTFGIAPDPNPDTRHGFSDAAVAQLYADGTTLAGYINIAVT